MASKPINIHWIGFEPDLSHTENSCIDSSYYTIIKIKIIEL